MARFRPLAGRPASGSRDPGVLRAYAELYASLADDEDIAEEQDWTSEEGYTHVISIIKTVRPAQYDPATGRQIRAAVREVVDTEAVSNDPGTDGLDYVADRLVARRASRAAR